MLTHEPIQHVIQKQMYLSQAKVNMKPLNIEKAMKKERFSPIDLVGGGDDDTT